MRTIGINVYEFAELSAEVKKKAIERLSDINVDYEWWGDTYEDANNIGLKLTGFDTYRNKHATGNFTLSAVEVAANILKEHGEVCDTYKTACGFLEAHSLVFTDYLNSESERYESREAEDELQEIEEDFLNSLLEDYATILQNEYEYLCSEETIIETIEANEYEFTVDGKIF